MTFEASQTISPLNVFLHSFSAIPHPRLQNFSTAPAGTINP